MDTSSLKVGTVFNSYKHACETLKQPIKGGDAKKAQLKDWQRYFKFKKEGYKMIVTKVYDIPLPENHNRTKYIAIIEKLILDEALTNNKNGKVFISKSKLMQTLQMVNENYALAKYKQFSFAKYMGISEKEIKDFYTTSDDLIKRNIETALNSLRNQSLIFWSNAITICKIDPSTNRNYANEIKVLKREELNHYGDEETFFIMPDLSATKIFKKADKEEIELVLKTEREVLKEMGYDSKEQVFNQRLSLPFYKQVKNILFDRYNIYNYYNSYEIVLNEDYIDDKMESLEKQILELEQKEKEKDKLNKQVMTRIMNNAKLRHEKAKQDNNQQNKLNEVRKKEAYTENNKVLANTLINNEAQILKYPFEIKP